MTAAPGTPEVGVVNGLYAFKPWYARRLRSIVDIAAARDISPDLFSLVGVLGAAVAAVGIARGWWLVAAAALAVRLAGANLDGAAARASGRSRPWGFVINELGDRASDLLMFIGLAALAARDGWTSPGVLFVCAAALAATLPTFASLAAAAASDDVVRLNGGPLGKTERCALAALAAAVPGWLPVIAVVIVAGSLVTAAARLIAVYGELG
jgi:CDP-diacylglycerol--glycerol-3-phosphate 3-phosphatidyltransferase